MQLKYILPQTQSITWICACGGFPGSGVIGFNWGNSLVTNAQLLRHTALMIYRTQQNPEVAEIPITVHQNKEKNKKDVKDAVSHVCHVSIPNAKQKMEITFVS